MDKLKLKGVAKCAISFLLGVVVSVGVVLGCGAFLGGWFDSSDLVGSIDTDTESEASSDNGLAVTTNANSGKLYISATPTVASTASSTVTNSDGDTCTYISTGSVTLTVTYNTDATNPTFTWTQSNTLVGLTVASDTLSCTVQRTSSFTTQCTVTCTADDSGLSASCTFDCIKTPTNSSFSFSGNSSISGSWSSTSSSCTLTLPAYDSAYYGSSSSAYRLWTSGCSYTPTVSAGTVEESYTLVSVKHNSYDNQSSYTYEPSLNGAYYLYSFLSNVYDIVASSSTANSLYERICSYPTVKFQLTFKGSTTGVSYSYVYTATIDASALYTSVSSTSLNYSAIAF